MSNLYSIVNYNRDCGTAPNGRRRSLHCHTVICKIACLAKNEAIAQSLFTHLEIKDSIRLQITSIHPSKTGNKLDS